MTPEQASERAREIVDRSRTDFADIAPGYFCAAFGGTTTRIAEALLAAERSGFERGRDAAAKRCDNRSKMARPGAGISLGAMRREASNCAEDIRALPVGGDDE